MLFSITELIDVAVMTLAIGYIFKDQFTKVSKNAFKFACLATAPALILHELGHKFLAMSFGLQAEFNAAYSFLLLGIILKLLNFGFIFFVPAYVSITGAISPINGALIAGMGPFVNLLLFTVSYLLLKQKKLKVNTYIFLEVTKQINLFLFVFNMLPIPMFDGFKFYQGIIRALF